MAEEEKPSEGKNGDAGHTNITQLRVLKEGGVDIIIDAKTSREMYIAEMWRKGRAAGYKYTSPGMRGKEQLLKRLGSSRIGYILALLSPEDAYLKIPFYDFDEAELIPFVILDPNKVRPLAKKLGIALDEKNYGEGIEGVRKWFLGAVSLKTGRILFGPDGKIGKSQKKEQAVIKQGQIKDEIVPNTKTVFVLHNTIHTCIASGIHATESLSKDRDVLMSVSSQISQLIADNASRICLVNELDEPEDKVEKDMMRIVRQINAKLKDSAKFFLVVKLMFGYISKLNGGQYDEVRKFWALKTLHKAMHDRVGKKCSIEEQTMLLEVAKEIELYRWKISLSGKKDKQRIHIGELLGEIRDDFDSFKKRIGSYVPLKNRPTFNPFHEFYDEWKSFIVQEKGPEQAQKIATRQYILMVLLEMRIRYCYGPDIFAEKSGENSEKKMNEVASLKHRIENLEILRQEFFSGADSFPGSTSLEDIFSDRVKLKDFLDRYIPIYSVPIK